MYIVTIYYVVYRNFYGRMGMANGKGSVNNSANETKSLAPLVFNTEIVYRNKKDIEDA